MPGDCSVDGFHHRRRYLFHHQYGYLQWMDQYNGTYHAAGSEEQAATIVLLKDKLRICFKDVYRNDREVFWYYDDIVNEKCWENGKAIVNYRGFPKQTIAVASKQFADELEERIAKQSSYFFLKAFGHSLPFLRILFVFFILLLIGYFWLMPYLALRLAEKVPVSYEENLGEGMYKAMKAGFKIDAVKSADINDFFKHLNLPSPYNIQITVVQDETPNAFALPGGNIIVYDKILSGMDDYTELAALLCHEFVHVQNRHTTKSLFRRTGNSAFLQIMLGNTHAISSVIIGQADNLKNLSYGRSLEKEADLQGLKMLAERKIDGNGFTRLLEMLKRQNAVSISEWMSSHPDLDHRIGYIQKDPWLNKNGVAENEGLRSVFKKLKANTAPRW